MATNITLVQGEILDEQDYWSSVELCRYAMLSLADLTAMVEEGVLDPIGKAPEEWQFSLRDFTRARVIARLQHDLDVNLPGAALIVELLAK